MLAFVSLFFFYQPSWSFRANYHLLRMMSQDVKPKQIIFLGTPLVAANVLTKLSKEASDKNFRLAAVVTQPPAPGKKNKIQKSPVHDIAESLSISVFCPEKASNETFLQELELLQPDLCITAAYGNFLPKRFLSIPKYGTINIHPSLLPLYRGASPLQRCLGKFHAKLIHTYTINFPI